MPEQNIATPSLYPNTPPPMVAGWPPVERTAASYPRSPGALDPRSHLGRQYAEYREAAQYDTRGNQPTADDLEAELQRFRAIVANAGPGSDWVEVAAAEAAIRYLPRHVTAAIGHYRYEQERRDNNRLQWERQWAAYTKLADLLAALEGANRRRPDTQTMEMLARELRLSVRQADDFTVVELRAEVDRLTQAPA